MTMTSAARSALVAAAAAIGVAVPTTAAAQPLVTAQVSLSGVLTGNVVQIPLTAIVPIQVCNNNVTAGVIAVSVDALGVKVCTQKP
jgi:hypothetical protein